MGAKKGNMAKGVVNGVECGVLIDSGAEVGIVPRSMVTKDCVLCGHVHIADVHGKTSYLLAGDVKSLKPSYDQPLYIGRVCVIVLAHVHSCVCAEGLQSRARGCTPLLQPRLRWVLTGALRAFDACALGSPLSGRSFASCCGRAFPHPVRNLKPVTGSLMPT